MEFNLEHRGPLMDSLSLTEDTAQTAMEAESLVKKTKGEPIT